MHVMKYATLSVRTVSPEDSIDEAISLMEEHDVHHLVVLASGRVVGIVSDRDVLLSTGWMLAAARRLGTQPVRGVIGPTRVDQIMSRPVECIHPSHSAREAAQIFVERRIGALPIVQNGRLLGLVTESDLARSLYERCGAANPGPSPLDGTVRDRMRVRVIAAGPRTPIADAVGLFRRYRIRHVPVAVRDRLLGIVSDRDVRRALGWSHVHDMAAEAEARLFDGPLLVMEIMHRRPRTTTPDVSLRDALGDMLSHRIHSLPVVDDDRLVGIITQTDYLTAIAREELL